MKKKFVLDTYALLAYLKQEQGHEKVRQLLVSANTEVFMNDINIGETYYIISRARGLEDRPSLVEATDRALGRSREAEARGQAPAGGGLPRDAVVGGC